MNKRAWIVALSVLALAACAGHKAMTGTARSSHADALVWVASGKIVVEPDPLRFTTDKRNVWVVWEIRDPESGWRFNHHNTSKPGIVVHNAGNEIVNCHQQANGRRYACFNIHRVKGEYKYDVNLHGPSALSLDPVLIND